MPIRAAKYFIENTFKMLTGWRHRKPLTSLAKTFFTVMVLQLSSLHAISLGHNRVIDTLRISDRASVQSLGGKMEFFLDRTNDMPLLRVLKEFREGRAMVATENEVNFTGRDGVIWCRFFVDNHTGDSVYFRLSSLFVEHIRLYAIIPDGFVPASATGFREPFLSRAFRTNGYVVNIPIGNTEQPREVVVSMQAELRPPLIIRPEVGTLKALANAGRKTEFISIGVLGILLVILFYNFCLWVVIKEGIYLYYCGYIVTAISCLLCFTGYSFEWLWPTHPEWNGYPWPMGFFYIGQLMFVNQLLKVRKSLPFLFPFCIALYAVSIGVCIAAWLPVGWQLALVVTGGTLIPLYFFVASLVLAFRGTKMAYIFLLGWFPILVVTILNILMISDVLGYSEFFDIHAVEAACAWEVVIFSLALGYRYSAMRQEKLDLQAENLRILSEQKNILRQAVLERTEEILAQNEQLVRNQEQIKIQNERLETQNRAYEKLREMILRQNQDLESAVKKRTLDVAQANEELKTTIQKLERFSYITAHNLRGPVARILGLSSLIDKKNMASTENVIIVDRLQSSAKDLDVIIHDLGTILAIQHGKVDNFEIVDFGSIVRNVMDNFAKEIADMDVQIELHASVHLIDTIPSCMESILANLISNSIKYRSEERTATIKIHAMETEDQVDIIVEDNGIGFDSEGYSDKVFEPFQRFHTHNKGKGLGLFLIKTQVSLLGGKVSLTGQVSQGVRVEINLPKRKIEEVSKVENEVA